MAQAKTRSNAEDRREEILDAAIEAFAVGGLHGTSVETIAARVGISQPYIFRLYGTKKELFVAAAARVCDRIQDAFERSIGARPNTLLAMGEAYIALGQRKFELLTLLHAFAASSDEEIRVAVSKRYLELWNFVAEKSGASPQDVLRFFADGMGLTVGIALGLDELFQHRSEDCP